MAESDLSTLNEGPDVRAEGLRLRSILGIVLVLGTILVIGWGGLRLTNPNTLPIRQVRIEGAFRHLSPSALEALVMDHMRGGFFTVDVEAIRSALLRQPWVKRVSVRRQWPDGLTVYVREQTPIARWADKGLLNVEGQFFSPDKNTIPHELTELNGPEGTQAQLLDRLRVLEVALRNSGTQLVRLNVSDRRAWSFELDNGLMVIVGRRDFDDRVRRFARIFPKALQGRVADIERVDLRYTNGFVVRWKAATPMAQG